MDWIVSNFGLFIFVFVAIAVVRAIVQATKLSGQNQADTNDTEEQRRVREIQERIRRKIAERRGGAAPLAPTGELEAPVERASPPPLPTASRIPPLEPFGGPMRRLVTQLERRVHQAPSAPSVADMAAVLERQEQLAKQMRSLEDARTLELRRAAQIVVRQNEETESAAGVRTLARRELLADLRDAQGLRRAFVLREVLGAPVALR